MVRSSLRAGIALFVVFCLLTLLKGGPVLLPIIFLFPGFILGTILQSEEPTVLKSLVFCILSGLIYMGCFYLLDLSNMDWVSLRLLMLSGCGSLLLKLAYDLTILTSFNFKTTLLFPFFIGIVASAPSSLCMFFLKTSNDTIGMILYCGIYLIYPLWFYCFAKYVDYLAKNNNQMQTGSPDGAF
jgi:hypothetical protein